MKFGFGESVVAELGISFCCFCWFCSYFV